MKIVLIDYGAGNIKSIQFALQRLGYRSTLSADVQEIREADKVIFPGVGEASSAMQMLQDTGIDEIIPQLTQPVLGICLGMQLMCAYTEEGSTKGLDIFEVNVTRFSQDHKVPHMGWNTVSQLQGALFDGILEESFMYSVHSYFVPLSQYTVASTYYGLDYSAALQKDNFYGVQFHPEKSASAGEQLLKNFLEL